MCDEAELARREELYRRDVERYQAELARLREALEDISNLYPHTTPGGIARNALKETT